MNPLANFFSSRLRQLFIAVNPENINAERCRKRGDRTIGTGKQGGNQGNDKYDRNEYAAYDAGPVREKDDRRSREDVLPKPNRCSSPPRKRKRKITTSMMNPSDHHILLRIFQRFYGNTFLHHLLVHPGHCDRDKHPGNDLFQERTTCCPDL